MTRPSTDERLRLAERSGDRDLLLRERVRAGRCPGCGDPTRHASRKIDTIRMIHTRQIHDVASYMLQVSLGGFVGSGEWEEVAIGGLWRQTDPCGRTLYTPRIFDTPRMREWHQAIFDKKEADFAKGIHD